MKRTFATTIACICCFFMPALLAQNSLFFNTLNKNHGLSSNGVTCIYEDQTGFMWFGTHDGLSMYNGYDFEIFVNTPTIPNSISNNKINAIVEEKETGNLWIGTSGGLNYFDRNSYRFIRMFSPNDSNMLTHQRVMSLCYDSHHNLWIGTGKGLNCYTANKKLINYKHNPIKPNSLIDDEVNTIKEDNNQNLWIGTEGGLCKYNKNSDDFRYINRPKLKFVKSIEITSKNEMWIGTYKNGLFRFKNCDVNSNMIAYTKENGYLLNGEVSGVVESEYGKIFVADRDGGLIVIDPTNEEVKHYFPDRYTPNSISSKALLSIGKSANGIIWIGSFNSGIDYIDNKRKQFEHYKINFRDDGLFNNNIRSMFQDCEGNVWIGTKEEGGLSKFNREKGTFVHYKPNKKKPYSLNDDYVFAINEIDSQYLLVGTFLNGLNVLDKSTGRFTHYKNNKNNPNSISDNKIYAIHKDMNGIIWIGTDVTPGRPGILNIFDPKNKTFKQIRKIEQAKCFLDEDHDNIWIGTPHDGLHLYNHKNDTVISYNTKNEDNNRINNNSISALKKDKDGNLWIATDGGGLNVLNKKTKQFKSYTIEDGLPNNRIQGIEIDNYNNLWLSTAGGLSKFDPVKQTFRNYDISDGLQGNEFEKYVSIKTRNGEMYFGGRFGFNVFDPDKIKDNIKLPNVIVTDFKIFNKAVPIGTEDSPLKKHISKTDKLVLNHTQSVITLEFVALNFTSPEKNQYAYRLENLEKEWNYCGTKRSATYTSLPAGTYNFHVKASNNDGYWNEEGKTITIVVLPPFWKTWWFISIVLIIVLGGIVLFFIVRIRIMEVQKEALEKQVQERTLALQDSNSILEEQQEQILEQNKNMITLSEFGQKLTASLNIQDISKMLYDYLSSLMDISAFGIGIYNDETKKIVFNHFIEENKKIPPFTRDIDNKNSLVSWCFTNQKTVFVNDWEKEYIKYVELMPKYSTTLPPLSNIHLPLTFENRPIGVIAINSFKKNAYSKSNLTNMQTVTSYLVIALENANAYKTIDEKNTNIEGSIRYAETIQKAILPPKPKINAYFESFIFYKPRDIVSGDFYWIHAVDKDDLNSGIASTTYIAAIDCTGHGVPGAFMSIIGSTHLNEIIKRVHQPYKILEKLNNKVKLSLKQNETENDDGMDVCLCRIDEIDDNFKVTFSGAKRPLYIFNSTDNKLSKFKGSLKSIGGEEIDHLSFFQKEIMLKKKDVIYLTSDGYIDQCNPLRKNYSEKRLLALLAEIGHKDMDEQYQLLDRSLNNFKEYENQRDDITVIGIKL